MHTILNRKEIQVSQAIRNPKFLTSPLLAFAVLTSMAVPSFAQPGQNSQLTVEINGLKNQQGQVCLSLFRSGKGFPSNASNALQTRCVAITAKSLFVTFENLHSGSYAVAVLHDTNSDNKANRNVLGIPVEGFGFSGNPVIRTGPPKFNDAAVLVAGSSTNIQIQLNYLFDS
ncbi:DUF2141 domain-containing protein [Scytonema sp. NUACC21]